MWQFAGRPAGIVVLAVLLVLAGLASLAESVEGVVTAAVGAWPAATLGAVIGLFILYRAYGLWYFRRFAWLMTILTLGLKAAVSAWTLRQGYAPHTAWVTLSLVVVIILYLLHPRIRTCFSANHHDSA
jgi:hypothetical protein